MIESGRENSEDEGEWRREKGRSREEKAIAKRDGRKGPDARMRLGHD